MVSCCGGCLMFLGFIFLAGGVAVYFVANGMRPFLFAVGNAVVDAARMAFVYNDGTDYGVKARAGGKRPLPSNFQQSYYLVTITNKADVQKGLKPIVKDVGPYVFSEYSRRFRVKKSSTDKTVTASSLTYYIYESLDSCALSDEGSATTIRDDLQVCSDWKTDKIVTYNPLWHAVMKLAHSSGMGEAFGAVLLGAKGLSSTFPALLPFSTNATTLAEKLGMAQVTHADCCGVGSSFADNAQLTAALGGVVPEFSCWTRRKRCTDGTETRNIPAYNNGGTGGSMQGSVLTSAQSVTVYDFFRNGTSVPTHCTATGGYPELIAEIDRLTSLVNTGYGNPAGVGAAHPLYALYVGIRDTANKLKVYGQYGFSYGQFRALYAYIIYAVIEAAKAGAYSATLAAPGGTVSAAAAAMTATGNSLCGANPYMGILPGVTGCTIMNDFLDYIINGMGRALAWDAGTIAASVALGNPADTYITELTAEQMLWTGYTSKFGTDLNLAPQPGQNILGFGRKGTDAGTGDQTATDQPTKWPTGISAPGGGETGPWDAIIQLGNGKYRAANAEVTKEDAYYEMCGTTNVCVGGCTASTSDYDTWTHSYNMKGDVGKDMAGEYAKRWGRKYSQGGCDTPVTGCHTGKTWNATKRTFKRPLKVEGIKVGTVWPKANGFKTSQNRETVLVPGSADQHFKDGDKATILVLGRPLDLTGTAPTIQYHGKPEKFQEFRTTGANLTTWLDSSDKLYGDCFYNVDPDDGDVEALLSAPHFAGCKDGNVMRTSAGGATFATYSGTAKTPDELAVAYHSKVIVSPLMGVAVGGSFKFGSYFHIRSSSLNALHPNMCSTTDLGAGAAWPATLAACASGNDWIVPYYWVKREALPTKAQVEIFKSARSLLAAGLGLVGMIGMGAYALLGLGACCCLTGLSMGGGSDEVKP